MSKNGVALFRVEREDTRKIREILQSLIGRARRRRCAEFESRFAPERSVCEGGRAKRIEVWEMSRICPGSQCLGCLLPHTQRRVPVPGPTAATAIIPTSTLGIFAIVLNTTVTPIGLWRPWSDTHFILSRVEHIFSFIRRSDKLLVTTLDFTRWAAPITALVFFAFFGFVVEARRNYALLATLGTAFWAAAARAGIRRPTLGFLAPKSTSASTQGGGFASGSGSGFGYTKPPPKLRPSVMDISLPAYTPSGTGSFSASFASTDLKRAMFFASFASASSRYVEHHPEHGHEHEHGGQIALALPLRRAVTAGAGTRPADGLLLRAPAPVPRLCAPAAPRVARGPVSVPLRRGGE
ncbi:hypothetical protein B0H11DRAFT_1914325 [Mycena galericulata]|nr:hypothetical protein B0H11DRAFT_1914325 [Mycena galericulata]